MIPSGSAAFYEDKNIMVLDNVVHGFDLHSFDTGDFIRTLKTEPTKRSFPRQVCLAECGTVVIGGGNDGNVHIFDRGSGEKDRCPSTLIRSVPNSYRK